MRKALSHACDYEAALDRLRTGHDHGGSPGNRLEPWHKKDLPVLRDMEAAQAALAASAHPDGFEMDYVYVTGDAPKSCSD